MRHVASILTCLVGLLVAQAPALAGARVAMLPPLPAHAHPVEPLGYGVNVEAPAAAPVAYAQGRIGRSEGCWQSYNPIYGLYQVAFCLGAQGRGTYRVVGGGYDCQGRSVWQHQGDVLVYQMQRGTCGRAADWTADQIVCRAAADHGRNLSCTYAPAVASQGPAGFSAFRQ